MLGKLYLSPLGRIFIHSKADGLVYRVFKDGTWDSLGIKCIPRDSGWRLIGDSYAKD